MANYPVDPIFFVPKGGILSDDGGELRKRRTVVSLSEDTSISRVLLKVLVDSTIDIPRSITVKLCHSMDGEGRSWTFPCYILNNELADGFPGDEDDLPPNGGNPHPFNGEVFQGEPAWVQQWVNEQMWQGAMDLFPPPAPANPQQDLNVEPFGGNHGWEPWPEEQAIQPQIEQQQEEISIQISGLSNAITSISSLMSGSSINNVFMLHTGSGGCQGEQPRVAPQDNFQRPEITLVYKRRQRAPATPTATTTENALPVRPIAPISDIGLRLSARIRAKNGIHTRGTLSARA
ncbi:hypothetical protein GUJ93_ZPchr0006g45812 [Zizania palustris]|uniref:Uncharacterized protein n=1 Tax=Zizania palustris TaxID=103762 RepID=A0A8J5VHC5_ZIZPA|nr:hypothetical protein GUJ93_ZPchr0006g45812 [Zizania palustris]